MSSFDRRTFLISLAALTGCGFSPAYGPGGAGALLRGKVDIDAPWDRESYNLNKRLTEQFGPSETPLYRLTYKISTSESQVGITRDQEILRYHVEGQVNYTLLNIATGQPLIARYVSSFTSYSATGSSVDTLTASRDAYARLMVLLADQMVSQIITLATPTPAE
ncbi:LPS assembly lipoprotein LptE [Celeribacter ethanolicus]|nr:LPS assembly lipoprotein LptE [Celeribacter ethanolicus]